MNAATKFTPGPWVAEKKGGRGAWIKSAGVETWTALACGDSDQEADANARLIAAAPGLFSALTDLLRCSGIPEAWAAHARQALAYATEANL